MQELLSTSSSKRAPAALLLFLLLVGGIEALAALSVISLRFSYPRWLVPFSGEEIYQEDRAIGWKNIPYGRVAVSQTGERLNSLGWRGPEWDSIKTFRIACLGDSTTYGVFSPVDRETYPRYLEYLLREAACPQCEVLNLGTNGYGSFQDEFLTRTLLPREKVRIAVFYFGWADRTRMMGWFDYKERARFLHSPLGRSYVVRWLVQISDSWVRELRYSRRLQKWFGPGYVKYGATFKDAEENLRQIILNSKQTGILAIFVTTPWQSDSALGPAEFEIRAYNELIRKLAAEYQIPLVDLEKKFKELEKLEKIPYFYPDRMHPNREGNAVIARELFLVIREHFDIIPGKQE